MISTDIELYKGTHITLRLRGVTVFFYDIEVYLVNVELTGNQAAVKRKGILIFNILLSIY